MRIPIGVNKKGMGEILDFLKSNVLEYDDYPWDFEKAGKEVANAILSSSMLRFELPRHLTKDFCMKAIALNNDCFDFIEI